MSMPTSGKTQQLNAIGCVSSSFGDLEVGCAPTSKTEWGLVSHPLDLRSAKIASLVGWNFRTFMLSLQGKCGHSLLKSFFNSILPT
jgi:hypothetical protein